MNFWLAYINPYSGKNFITFFGVLAKRFWLLLNGQLSFQELVTDEVQVLVLLGVAGSCALIGALLVLRKMAMLANALSHTILLGIVVAYLLSVGHSLQQEGQRVIDFQAMVVASILTGIATTLLTNFFHKSTGLHEDASIGLVFTTLFALSIMLVTLYTRNAHIGTEVVMGNADSLRLKDIGLVWKIFVIDAIVCLLFFKEFRLTTFDAGFATAIGFSPGLFNYLLMVLLAATTIGAFRAVGVVMVLALLVGPALAARQFTHRLSRLLLLAMALGGASALLGVALSRHVLSVYGISLSTGGLVVCCVVLLFLFSLILPPCFAPKEALDPEPSGSG